MDIHRLEKWSFQVGTCAGELTYVAFESRDKNAAYSSVSMLMCGHFDVVVDWMALAKERARGALGRLSLRECRSGALTKRAGSPFRYGCGGMFS